MLLQLLQRVPRGLGSPCAARCRLCFSVVSLHPCFAIYYPETKENSLYIYYFCNFLYKYGELPLNRRSISGWIPSKSSRKRMPKVPQWRQFSFRRKARKIFLNFALYPKRKNIELFDNEYMILSDFQSKRETLYHKSFSSGVTRPSIPLPSPPLSVSPQSTAFTRQPCLFCFGYGGPRYEDTFWWNRFFQKSELFRPLKILIKFNSQIFVYLALSCRLEP